MLPRPYVLSEANYRQLLDDPPNLAVLPWGATEAHNYHLPHGTDNIEITTVGERAAQLAHERGAKVILLPTVPFGNDAAQLDGQVATIHLGTAAATAILRDVVISLKHQGIDRLLLLNGHGGHNFQPLIRDAQLEFGILIVLVDFWAVAPEASKELFENPGDHANEFETSLMLSIAPDLVQMEQAGPGEHRPWGIEAMNQPGVWTPRPWSKVHPDTGSGDPSRATAKKGERWLSAATEALSNVMLGLSKAQKGDMPYV